jgi:hypothetical protein
MLALSGVSYLFEANKVLRHACYENKTPGKRINPRLFYFDDAANRIK